MSLTVTTAIFRIIIATLCGAIIGFDRLISGHSAGIRTHAILALGSSTFIVSAIMFTDVDAIRVAGSVVSGIGFLGVGTILTQGRKDVSGLTTAAGLWTTSIIGVAVGVGQYVIALVSTSFVILLILFVRKFNKFFKKNAKEIRLYVELSNASYVNSFEKLLQQLGRVDSFVVTPPKSGTHENTGVEIEIKNTEEITTDWLQSEILKNEFVVFVI